MQNSTKWYLCLNVLVSLVLENMLTLHLANTVTHRRLPCHSPNYNVFVAHRSNAMFIHISISNVLCMAHTVQSIRLAADPVIKSFTASSGAGVLSSRVSAG